MENPTLVFLVENILQDFKMKCVWFKCVFGYFQVMECRGCGKDMAGGVALMWNENLKVNILSYSPNHIGGSVMYDEVDISWFFTCIYGFLGRA